MPNRYLVLLLMFVGASSTAATVPYMGLFIVEKLQMEPWTISVFSALETMMVLFVNRYLGRQIDEGGDIRLFLCISITAYIIGVIAMLIAPSYWTLIGVYAPGLAIASGSVSTMFSFVRFYAERNHINILKFNMQVRAMASLAWMIAPAATFTLAGLWGHMIVFQAALGLGVLWLLVWRITFRAPFRRTEPMIAGGAASAVGITTLAFNSSLWIAAAVCLCLSVGNALVLSASALYYVQEVGLPHYAPGLALSMKCFVEVVIILGAPKVLRWAGLRNSLIFSALLGVICFIYLAQIGSMHDMLVAAALEGAYFGIFAAVGVPFVQSFARGRIGHATSMFSNSIFLGGMIGGSLMGLIASVSDYRTVILSACVAAIAAAVTLLLTRRSDQEAEQLAA